MIDFLNVAPNTSDKITWINGKMWKYETYEEYMIDEDRKRKKAELDLKIAKKLHSTYWWTFVLAVGGFLISIYLLILKLQDK